MEFDLTPSKAIAKGHNDGSLLIPSIVKLTINFLIFSSYCWSVSDIDFAIW